MNEIRRWLSCLPLLPPFIGMMLLLAYIISSILDDLGDSAFNFISLPYLDGEDLELFNFEYGHLHNLWLLPITESERNYKIENSWDELEQRFEDCGFDYLNPQRDSCA